MSEKLDFEVTQSREIAGRWCRRGETVRLTRRAAKYYLAPYGSGLVLPSRRKPKVVAAAATGVEEAGS
ncbi:hypothetical protein [Pseudooceanicola sp. HF7]|uniref:hypothetical protein n=1 Tax=Pseudooceanicola sp. HF7 TaxID=2721560 RepID=UPI00142FED49|nr:hypothetical protein [Pseudooceanicola sp. HF7]NIZ11086.1 hypothetical protein [Pseudooceanicola sp. HF7]